MEFKVIRNSDDHKILLVEAERLIEADPKLGSADGDRLELIALLIEDYEKRTFPFESPDPIEAIEFRMQEQGLRQIDLVPMLGSRSRASEVLSRKRPLTVQMIRAVSTGLGIPLEVLIAERKVLPLSLDVAGVSNVSAVDEYEWDKFPIKEMQRRGWINLDPNRLALEDAAAQSVKKFLTSLGEKKLEAALFRRSFRGEILEEKAFYSTLAWTGRVMTRAKEENVCYPKFNPTLITNELFRELAQLSSFPDGPTQAVIKLAKLGIAVIVEPKLPNTLLDGAALMSENGTPVIGLTLRYDRVDYFWFTLLHELAHVWKHLLEADEGFIDRIENSSPTNLMEKEANRIARDALIPRSVWKRSSAYLNQTKAAILELASDLKIHPGIIVGRIQKETERYEIFRDLLGQGTIRPLFNDVQFT